MQTYRRCPKPRFATLSDGTLQNILNDKDSDNNMVMQTYEFGLSLCKIVRSSVILLLPLFIDF
jgi:hypothetical protein